MKPFYQFFIIITLIVSGSGCVGTLVPTERLDDETKTVLDGDIREVDSSWVRDSRFVRLQSVSAISCKNKVWDPTPSREDAVAQLKLQALRLGATAIGSAVCERPEGTNLATNCWSSITCSAVALKDSSLGRSDSAVTAENAEPLTSSGSGFFVAENVAITNQHVVEGCTSVELLGAQTTYLGQVIKSDKTNDLAAIRTDKSGIALPLRGKEPLRRGETVVVVGYPLGGLLAQGASVATGSLTALSGIGGDSRMIQISAPVQQGNSGGPVVDSYGNVVGVVQGKLNALAVAAATGDIPQNVNFAIKSSGVREFLIETGEQVLEGSQTKLLASEDAAVPALASTVKIVCTPTKGR